VSDTNPNNPNLDKGWGCLDEGDFAGARRLAEREMRDDPENPEALLLLAACCRGEGDSEKALGLLEQASHADEDWGAPSQWMAEILAEDLGRPADALKFAALALDRAEEETEFLDAVVLKAGLEIQLGKIKSAQGTLGELPPAAEVQLPPDLSLDLAYLFLEADLTLEAEQRFQALAESDPSEAESWYGLGLCAEAKNDEAAKRVAWLRVLEIDSKSPLQDPHMSEADMAEVAEQALQELPEPARKLIANVPILIVDLPARAEIEQGLDPRLLGMFEGTAYSDGGALGGAPQVTQILLFRKNLERMAIDPEDLREQIRITLLHETGHFFGMSEDDLADVGLD
jgi:predicted Zn-dependent protease with MMP-like domain/thioredoxin-like negative regulator of GroEL